MTWSPLRILFMALLSLENFGCQRHDLHELLGAQFARDRSEDAGADGLQLGVEQHSCVAVEFDEGAVCTTDALGGANHHCTVDLAFFDATARSSFLDADLDDVAHAGITPLGATEHLDTQDGFRARVVGHIEPGFSLDHVLIFPTCTVCHPGWIRLCSAAVSLGPVVHTPKPLRCASAGQKLSPFEAKPAIVA